MITNEGQAKAQLNALSRKYPDATHKGWEARKAYAKEFNINVKVFNKGLGPQISELSGLIKGVNEVNNLVPVDDRSFKAFPAEKAKLDRIVNDYLAIVSPHVQKAGALEYYGWWALKNGLDSVKDWSDKILKQAQQHAAARKR